MNKQIMASIFPVETERVEKGLCPFCGKEVKEEGFRDELSKREFKISGLCQTCQDETFKY